MAKFTAWVGKPGGGGIALDTEGKQHELAQKPDESQFVDRPAGAPTGDFVRALSGRFEPSLAQPGGQVRDEFIGERLDRENEQVKQAGKLQARIGAKEQLDNQQMSLGYTPAQERTRQALRDARSTLESDFAEGKWTPEDMSNLEAQITAREKVILPQMIRKQPTPQSIAEANIVTINGQKGFYDVKKNKFTPLSVGIDIEFKDYQQGLANMTERMSDIDDDGREIKPDPADVETAFLAELTQYQAFMGHIRGADMGVQGQAAGGQPQPQQATGQQPVDVEGIFQAGIAEMAKTFNNVSAGRMNDFGEKFVAEAVAGGMSADEAVAKFMELWEAQRKIKGTRFRVPKPSKSAISRVRDAADKSRLEFLRAKARQ